MEIDVAYDHHVDDVSMPDVEAPEASPLPRKHLERRNDVRQIREAVGDPQDCDLDGVAKTIIGCLGASAS